MKRIGTIIKNNYINSNGFIIHLGNHNYNIGDKVEFEWQRIDDQDVITNIELYVEPEYDYDDEL